MDDFFTYENLAQITSTARVWTLASIIFLKRNPDLLKMISVFISVLFLAGIVYSIRRGLKEVRSVRNLTLKDILGLSPSLHPRSLKAWRTVLHRLATKEEGQLKLAAIEADRLFDHLLIAIGYRGRSFAERFGQLTASQISNLKDIGEAHEIVEKMLNEPDTQITYEGAERVVNIYKKAFEEMGLIDPTE